MPGKVNPVMCESLMQAATWAIGNDAAVAMAGAAGGQFQLNIMMPMMGHGVLQSVVLLAKVTNAFVDLCAEEMQANREQCEAMVEKSLSMVTSLNPHIGYERAAALAKEAFKTATGMASQFAAKGMQSVKGSPRKAAAPAKKKAAAPARKVAAKPAAKTTTKARSSAARKRAG